MITRSWLSILPRLWTNWVTLAGSIITTVAGCTLLLTLAADLISPAPNPYASAFIFLIAPVVFAVGLLLIPIGLLWERRRKRTSGPWTTLQAAFETAFEDGGVRRGVTLVGLATLLNIVILGAAGHRALIYMDSVEFCGTMCHSVMQPEYEAYLRSPHQRVACVDCHIGPGASWAVRSKISGLRQVLAVARGTFSRPIPTPVAELRPARDTCEQCHWPAKFHGNRVLFRTHYADDADNSETVSAVMLKVGGANPKTKSYHGIHWHVSSAAKVRYEALDPTRERIGKVSVVKNGEVTRVYEPPDADGEVHEVRTMDCVDCHNRPTHIYDQSAELAVDRAFSEGRLDPKVPFLHAAASSVLTPDDAPRAGTEQRLRQALVSWYADNHADVKVTSTQLDTAAQVLADLYLANIFPDMRVGWGTHPTHLGHHGDDLDTRGCFRCHDDEHEAESGDVLSQDCDLCHEVLYDQEPPESIPESLSAIMNTRN